MHAPGVVLDEYVGAAVRPRLDALAALRIAVFREYPYRYDGDLDYEREYLETYARSPESFFALARTGERVIGATTAVPLADEVDTLKAPFRGAGIDPERVCYFGESVLLPEWRGQGLGHAFFDAREAYARRLGRFEWTAFCAVVRPDDDPARPAQYRPLDGFWRARGYTPRPDLVATLSWKEIDEPQATAKPLRFWLRALG